jgi:hypothetical protein
MITLDCQIINDVYRRKALELFLVYRSPITDKNKGRAPGRADVGINKKKR